MASEEFKAFQERMAAAPAAPPPASIQELRDRIDASMGNLPLAEGTSSKDIDAGGVKCILCSRDAGSDDPLFIYFHGGGFRIASALAYRAYGSNLAKACQARVLLVDPEPALAEALPGPGDARLRAIVAPEIEPGTSASAALRIAASCAHGRHLVYLPGPVAIDGLDHLIARLERASGRDGAGPIVHAVDAQPGAAGRALTIVSRRALDRLDGIDAFAADPVGEFAARARRTFGAAPVDDIRVRASVLATRRATTVHECR